MFHDVRKSVWDALNACRMIREFTQGHTLESHRLDRRNRLAIERLFEILGEAFSRIDKADPSFRKYLPEMGNVIGMRNRISHGYDYVDDATVWVAVEENIPALAAKLAAWLDEHQM